MMSTPGGYKTVVLRNVGAVDHAVEPWPRVFLVTRMLLSEGQVELRPLTVRSFFALVLRNWLTSAVWNGRHLCWRVGFIDFDERRMAETNYWGDWRWRWWLPRVGRAPVKEFVRALTESEVVTLPSAAVPGSAVDPDAPLMDGHLKPLGDDLAKTLFGAYNDQGPNPWKTWDGKDVPRWDALSDQVREKWRAVARGATNKATEALRQLLSEDGFSPTREGWVERVGMWQRRAETAEAAQKEAEKERDSAKAELEKDQREIYLAGTRAGIEKERERCALIARDKGAKGDALTEDAARREADVIADEIETAPIPDTIEGLKSLQPGVVTRPDSNSWGDQISVPLAPGQLVLMPVEDPITPGQRAVLVAADEWVRGGMFHGTSSEKLGAAVRALREAPAKIEKP